MLNEAITFGIGAETYWRSELLSPIVADFGPEEKKAERKNEVAGEENEEEHQEYENAATIGSRTQG